MNTRNSKEIHFLQRENEIVILEISRYNNRVKIFDLEKSKKILDVRIRKSIILFYKNSGMYKHVNPKDAKAKLKANKLADYLLPSQTKLFQQTELI